MKFLLSLLSLILVSATVASAAPIVPKRINVTANAIEVHDQFLAWRIKDKAGTTIGIMSMGCHGSPTGKIQQRQCNATMALPKGKIHFSGQIFYNTIFSLTITGGTGIFVDTHGVFVGIKYAIGRWKMDVYFH